MVEKAKIFWEINRGTIVILLIAALMVANIAILTAP